MCLYILHSFSWILFRTFAQMSVRCLGHSEKEWHSALCWDEVIGGLVSSRGGCRYSRPEWRARESRFETEMEEFRNSFLPDKEATWNMRGKAILVACMWRTSWSSCLWDPELFEGGQPCLSWQQDGYFSTLSLTPQSQLWEFCNPHAWLMTTSRSLEQKAVSPAMRRRASGRPQFPRDCLWVPRVGYVSTQSLGWGSGLWQFTWLPQNLPSAWCDAGLGEVDRAQVDQASGPCVRGPRTARADPGICLLIGSLCPGRDEPFWGMSLSWELLLPGRRKQSLNDLFTQL